MTLGGWAMRSVADAVKTNASLAETSANEFGAASRQSFALGPGSHSARAACARESRGENRAQTLNRAFPEACNAAKRSGRRSGTQRKNSPRSGAESHLSQRPPCTRPSAREMPRAWKLRARGALWTSRRAWRAEPRGRSSSPAGGHIDTARPGRWPRVEASRPPRGLRRLSVRRPSDPGTGGGVTAKRRRSPVGAALAPHHHRASCPSSPGCCFIIVGLLRIIVAVFPHHRRVIGPSPAPPPRARRWPVASPARRRW